VKKGRGMKRVTKRKERERRRNNKDVEEREF
jgi:hypothetical protein